MQVKKWKLMLIIAIGSLVSWGLATQSVWAQSLGVYPTYYQVFNVASNDVLNARADSDSESPIIGSLAYDEPLVEVIRQEHNWGYVALDGQMGWVSMNYLRQIVPPSVGDSPIPENLSCGGTEPFWGLHVGQSEITYSQMDGGDATFAISEAKGFAGFAGQDGFVQAGSTLSLLTAVFSTQQCSDGMSDLDFGWRVDLVINSEAGVTGYSGCCQLIAAP